MAKHLGSFRKASSCSGAVNAFKTKKVESRWKDELLIFKSAVIGTIDGSITFRDRKDMYDLVEPSYSDGVVGNIDEYHQQKVERMTDECYRRCVSEHHRVEDGNALVQKSIKLDLSEFVNTEFEDCDNIIIDFDIVYKDPGVLTGIVLQKGLPNISATARGERRVDNSIELHLMIKALKKLADEMYPGGTRINLVAAYHFSAKTKDNSLTREPLYFGKDEPVRALSEVYTTGDKSESKLDTKLKELLDGFCTGCDPTQMNEDKDCKGCPNYSLCYYKPAPVHQVIEESSGVKKKVVHSDEQQAVIDTVSGVSVVNAAAGSGKTATTVDRIVTLAFKEMDDIVSRIESGEDVSVKLIEYACNDSRA